MTTTSTIFETLRLLGSVRCAAPTGPLGRSASIEILFFFRRHEGSDRKRAHAESDEGDTAQQSERKRGRRRGRNHPLRGLERSHVRSNTCVFQIVSSSASRFSDRFSM